MDVVECIGTKCSKVLEGIREGCAAISATDKGKLQDVRLFSLVQNPVEVESESL